MVSWSHGSSYQTSSNAPSHGWDQFPSWVSPTPEKHLSTLSPSSFCPSVCHHSRQLYLLHHYISSVSPPSTAIPAGVAVTSLLALCSCLPACPSHLIQLFILGFRHCYCLLIFKCCSDHILLKTFQCFNSKIFLKFPLLLVYLSYRGLDPTRILSYKYIIYFDHVSPTPTSWWPYHS